MKEVINYMVARLSRVAMITGILAGVTVPALAVHAQQPGICTFGGHFPRNITVNGTRATATFTIPNGINNSCARDGALQYSLVSYTAPNASMRPFSSQKLFDSTSRNFLPGTHTMSVSVPKCGFYQIDLVKGGVITQLHENGNYADQARLIHATSGGHACTPVQPTSTPQTPPQTPPAAPTTTIVNNNTNTNTNVNQQQQQQTTAPPAQTQAQAQQATPAVAQTQVQTEVPATEVAAGKGVSELPNTGPGSIAAIFTGVSVASGLAYNLVMRRRHA